MSGDAEAVAPIVAMKDCNDCGLTKPLDEFSPNTGGYMGRCPKCKVCRRRIDVESRAAKRAGIPVPPRRPYRSRTRPTHLPSGEVWTPILLQHDKRVIALNQALFGYLRATVRDGDNGNAWWRIP